MAAVFQIKNIPEKVFEDFKIKCIRDKRSMNKVCNDLVMAHTYGNTQHQDEIDALNAKLDESLTMYNDLIIKTGTDPDSIRKPGEKF